MQRTTGLSWAICLLFATVAWSADTLEFKEAFAWGDRDAALSLLVPGTEEHFFHRALHRQLQGDSRAVTAILQEWGATFGSAAPSPRFLEIMRRQALLDFERDPEQAWKTIEQTLDLRFDHRREDSAQAPVFPTTLSPALYSLEAFEREAWNSSRDSGLRNYRDRGLELLLRRKLSPEQRRAFLSRLTRPDLPGLVELVADDLGFRDSLGFGQHAIHFRLTRSQLEELGQRRPELLRDLRYVQERLSRIPQPPGDLRLDPALAAPYFQTLWDFLRPLEPMHNSLKASVLFQLLDARRRLGTYSADLFRQYLELPRRAPFIAPLRRQAWQQADSVFVDLRARFDLPESGRRPEPGGVAGSGAAGPLLQPLPLPLPPIGQEEPLIREYLTVLLREAEDVAAWERWFESRWLGAVFAEAKILHGLGRPEDWASFLTPAQYRELIERVELRFTDRNPPQFSPGQPVELEIEVKRVDRVMVTVFEIQTHSYYTTQAQPVALDIDLDGRMPTHQWSFPTAEAPGRRLLQRISLPQVSAPGVYLVELVGGGLRSRACIRLGRLEAVSQATSAGQVVTVLDEAGRHRPQATLWVEGREFAPDASGRILLPYSGNPGSRRVVLRDGDFSHLVDFQWLGEEYRFSAGIHLDPQALRRGGRATLMLRPDLRVHGLPVALSRLSQVRVSLRAVDARGIPSERQFAPEFQRDAEWVETFSVPDDLREIEVAVEAVVHLRGDGEAVNLRDHLRLPLNSGRHGTTVRQAFLQPTAEGWKVEVRGLNGEPVPGLPVSISLEHPGFSSDLRFQAMTDQHGRIDLGHLAGIRCLSLSGPDLATLRECLDPGHASYPERLHLTEDEEVSLPFPFATTPGLASASLLRLENGRVQEVMNDRLRWDAGELRLQALPAGEYQLLLLEPEVRIFLAVERGPIAFGHILGSQRRLQKSAPSLPSLGAVEQAGDKLRIKVRHPTATTRLFVRAARYEGAGSALPLGLGFPRLETRAVQALPALYASEMRIGDEHRYVLERRHHEPFAGSLLDRPGLLLNPWKVAETSTSAEDLRDDSDPFPRLMDEGSYSLRRRISERDIRAAPDAPDPSRIGFDFLPQGSRWWVGLVPGPDGVVELPLDGLGEHTFLDLTVLDRFGLSRTRHFLPDAPLHPRDQRMRQILDPERAFSRQQRVAALPAGGEFTFEDRATARHQVIGSLAQAFDFLRALASPPGMDAFSFLKHWHELDPSSKRARYAESACHELHLFLKVRDPDFFAQTVRPYLENKMHRTFLDRWLLDALQPEDFRLDHMQDRNALELALLARHGEPGKAALRSLQESVESLPRDPGEAARRARVALGLSVLEVPQSHTVLEDGSGEVAWGIPQPWEAKALRAPTAGFMGSRMAAPLEASADRVVMSALSAVESARGMDYSSPGDVDRADDYFDISDLESLEGDPAPVLFRALPPTSEWAEQNYHKVRAAEDRPDRIQPNQFWLDVAAGVVVSPNLLQVGSSLSEVLAALAWCGLPGDPAPLEEVVEADSLRLRPGAAMILVSEQVLPALPAEGLPPILLSQQFFDPQDRYRQEGGENVEVFVTDEFMRQRVYGARVTLTNPTASARHLEVLLQIPEGSIPVSNGFYTDSLSLTLDPFATRTVEYAFTFPKAGRFLQAPAQAAIGGAIVGRAEPQVFRVVEAPSGVDPHSWPWVSQHASAAQVLDFLRQHNLRLLDLDRIAWRLRDRDFFREVAAILGQRGYFHHTLLSYAIHHRDPHWAPVWLSRSRLVSEVGLALQSPLLSVDPVHRRSYEHLDYEPLVNPRAHPLAPPRRILNRALESQYQSFLAHAAYRPALDDQERLALVYFLLLQDRLAEARDQVSRITEGSLRQRLQWDYLRAWLALRTLDLDQALNLAQPYLEHPIERWKARFRAVAEAVAAARGEPLSGDLLAGRQPALDSAAEDSPTLSLRQEGGQILVVAHNLPQATLNLYPMDVEMLFSRRPFLDAGGQGFGVVKPARSIPLVLPPDGQETVLELPPDLGHHNLVVEVEGRGLRRSLSWHANQFRIRLMADFGQLEVRSAVTGAPLPMTYVKVYARSVDGAVSFWKDGYTDLRGRFDYLSRHDRPPEDAARFSILVLHPEHGASIHQTAPPAR